MSKIKLINEVHPELTILGLMLDDTVEAQIRDDEEAAYFNAWKTITVECVVYKPDFEII